MLWLHERYRTESHIAKAASKKRTTSLATFLECVERHRGRKRRIKRAMIQTVIYIRMIKMHARFDWYDDSVTRSAKNVWRKRLWYCAEKL